MNKMRKLCCGKEETGEIKKYVDNVPRGRVALMVKWPERLTRKQTDPGSIPANGTVFPSKMKQI